MNLALAALLFFYPHGFFGVMASSGSDAGMMLEKGVFALEYNPAGLGWVDSLQVGVAGEGLFRYYLVGASFKYSDWPLGVSVHHQDSKTGFTIGGSRLTRPFAWGAAFSVSIDSVRGDTLSLRAGIQWGDYVGLALGPQLSIGNDNIQFSGIAQLGAEIPIKPVEGLFFLIGTRAEAAPATFGIGGGAAYELFDGLVRFQSVVAIDEWGVGLLLDNVDDKGGIWVRKGFLEEDWQFGLSYVRDLRPEKIQVVEIQKGFPVERVDTVYLPQQVETQPVSEEILKRQDELMAKANRLYVAGEFEEAIGVWNKVVNLAPSTDLGKLARKNIRDVEALLKTLENMDSDTD
ncbi:hypothetical protein GF359_08715 [candidate division WOR-3 bacterium]|uniref:Uncharacterized protein n=1 Tax=candidate division WOR-3 bacterium TaxID=2052148 RepID=A0A9D5KAK6_UNCW3|nr:hypothetical protein [candidate division WOR-3 bacterium]MBD3365282.1 hypothetical protein [candidate division WOR-3 bacterium]